MWSSDESEHAERSIPEVKPALNKVEAVNVNDNGLAFSAAKYFLSWIGSNAKRGKSCSKFQNTENEVLEHQGESLTTTETVDDPALKIEKEEPRSSFPLYARDTVKAALVHFEKRWYRRLSFIWRQLVRIVGSFSKLWVSRSRQFILERFDAYLCVFPK